MCIVFPEQPTSGQGEGIGQLIRKQHGALWAALDLCCCLLTSLNLKLTVVDMHPVCSFTGTHWSFPSSFWVAVSVAPLGLPNRSLCNSIKTSSVVSGRVLQPGNYTLKGPVSPQLWHLFPDGGSVEPGLTSPDSFFLNNKAVTTCCTSVMGFLHIWLLA